MMRNLVWIFLFIFLEIAFVVYLGYGTVLGSKLSHSNDRFRNMEISESYLNGLTARYGYGSSSFFHVLARDMMENSFCSPQHFKDCFYPLSVFEDRSLSMYNRMEDVQQDYETILGDLKNFPVLSDPEGKAEVTFENSWGVSRSYGGERSHEGTDIIASNNERGYFQIVSMSDGVVEQIGWLELGGYRIGIRTPKGAYVYYAHMAEYAEGIQKGSRVKAGQVLGTMGDTGYSKVEGTTGNFDVHLHLGIYYNRNGEECSVNPYYILKFLTQ